MEDHRETSSFVSVRNCFSEEGGLRKDVEFRVGWGLKNFGAMKMMLNIRVASFDVKMVVF